MRATSDWVSLRGSTAPVSPCSQLRLCKCLSPHSSVTSLRGGTSAAMIEGRPSSGRRVQNNPDKDSRMKRIVITLLALAYATRLFAADPSPPDQGKTGARPAQHRFWERLQLTDDQKAKLQEIREADRDSLRSAWAQVRIARESLKAALLATPENSADIQTKATNLANALSTSTVQMAMHRAKIYQVLTPVKRVALDEARGHVRRWHRPGGGAERGPWQRWHPWPRQNQSPQQTPAARPDSQTPPAPTN
jgi:Spy/CpxP family protein refolding chaperone